MFTHEGRRAVLVVDDDRDVRALVRESITRLNRDAIVVESDNGADALFRAGRQKFDLVITDLKMPKKDGTKLMHGLLSLARNLQPANVIVLSAHFGEEGMKIPSGVRTLRKPCTDEELNEAISAVLPPAPGRAQPQSQKALVDLVTGLTGKLRGVLDGMGLDGLQQSKPFVQPPGALPDGTLCNRTLKAGELGGSVGIWVESTVNEKLSALAPEGAAQGDWSSAILGALSSELGLQLEHSESERAGPVGPAVVLPFSSSAGRVWILTAVKKV